jgi:hypothetical protein
VGWLKRSFFAASKGRKGLVHSRTYRSRCCLTSRRVTRWNVVLVEPSKVADTVVEDSEEELVTQQEEDHVEPDEEDEVEPESEPEVKVAKNRDGVFTYPRSS